MYLPYTLLVAGEYDHFFSLHDKLINPTFLSSICSLMVTQVSLNKLRNLNDSDQPLVYWTIDNEELQICSFVLLS